MSTSTRREERTWQGPTPQQRLAILRRARSVAVVGASDNPARASYFVVTYLLASSPYRVHLVNPRIGEALGQPVHGHLRDLPETPDVVVAFRRHEDLPHVLEDTLAVGAGTLWLQLGLWHEGVAREAEAAGLDVVMDRCVKIEHARFAGGLHLAGFDTGVIDSHRSRGSAL